MRLIYHLGTGTWFAAGDDVYVLDTRDFFTEGNLLEVMEQEGDELARKYGRRADLVY